jgi:hypothetical protein
MAAQGVDELCALTNQKIAGPKDHAGSLLLFRLDCSEAHARSLRCLAIASASTASFLCRFTNGLT